MCTSFSHISQLFRKSSGLSLVVSTATTGAQAPLSVLGPSAPYHSHWHCRVSAESCYPFAHITLMAPDLTQSTCSPQGPMWYMSLQPPCLSDLVSHQGCLPLPRSSPATLLSSLFLRHTSVAVPGGWSLWLLHSFSRYPHGETSHVLLFFANISLLNEDNLAYAI